MTTEQYLENSNFHPELNFVSINLRELTQEIIKKLKSDPTIVLISNSSCKHSIFEQRSMFIKLINADCKTPMIVRRIYKNLSKESLQLQSATDIGALLVDGFGDGVILSTNNCGSIRSTNETAFGILQASRTRITKTDYISCPSCGRTLFDLQTTTAKIKSVTDHLKGLKIGIMGCIVNGPGEMADADYGYVGTGSGLISLYKGHHVVQKNIPEMDAVESLINLIKKNGDWSEPKC
jgi:(E)-4-hydroxy-3-methylbut-2-enyl-diphosphate synthase